MKSLVCKSMATCAFALFTITLACSQPVRLGPEFESVHDVAARTDIVWTIGWFEELRRQHWQNGAAEGELTYKFAPFTLLGGSGLYHTWEERNANLLEIRSWQGVAARFPEWPSAYLEHRLLMEERWQHEKREWEFSPRLRYRVASRFNVIDSDSDLRPAYVFLGAEWFNNFNEPLNERFSSKRIYSVRLGLSLSQSSIIEFRYESELSDNFRESITGVDVHTARLKWIRTW